MISPKKFILVTFTFFTVFFLWYGGTLDQWMSRLTGKGEDGAKNFFTLAYHVQHDGSALWFDGMNYPFGEHVSFTDNQPLFSIILQALNQVIPITPHLTTILPWLIILSFLVGSLYLFAIFDRLGITLPLSVSGAVGIMFLSPQWLRLAGHYSLAYAFVVPIIMYLLLLALEGKQRVVPWMILILFLFGMIHPYLMVMSSLFASCALAIGYLHKRVLLQPRNLITTILLILGPIALFQLFIGASDPIMDRPDSPYGFLVYRATLSSVFLPINLIHGAGLSTIWNGWFQPSLEGSFYLGLLGIMVGGLGLFQLFKSFILRRADRTNTWRPPTIFLLASLPILVLALGLPFLIPGLEGLLDWTGPLRQFRGIGRFAFVVFYAVNVFAIYKLDLIIQTKGKTGKILATILVVALFSEAYAQSKYIIASTSDGSDVFTSNQWKELEVDYSKYQAILPLPYYHIGSENFRTADVIEIKAPSMALSLSTGLPLTSVQLSRTSYAQTKKSLEMVSPLTRVPQLISSFDDRPLLVICYEPYPLKPAENALKLKAHHLYTEGEFNLYELDIAAFEEVAADALAEVKHRQPSSVSLPTTEGSIDSISTYFQSYDSKVSPGAFRGDGCLTVERSAWTNLVPPGFEFPADQAMNISFWISVAEQSTANTQLWFEEKESGAFYLSEVCDYMVCLQDDWMLVNINLSSAFHGDQVSVTLHRDGPSQTLHVDNLIIRPVAVDVSHPSSVNLNNLYYN